MRVNDVLALQRMGKESVTETGNVRMHDNAAHYRCGTCPVNIKLCPVVAQNCALLTLQNVYFFAVVRQLDNEKRGVELTTFCQTGWGRAKYGRREGFRTPHCYLTDASEL